MAVEVETKSGFSAAITELKRLVRLRRAYLLAGEGGELAGSFGG